MADFSTTVVTQVTQAVVLSTVQQVVQVNSAIPGNYLSAPRLGFGIYSVKDPIFGAAGDGVTNDTAAFRAAFAAASVAGGEVWVPSGTYLVDVFTDADKDSAPIIGEGVQVVGAGYNTRILLNVASYEGQTGDLTAWFFKSHSSIRNLRIDGNRTAVEVAIGLASGTGSYVCRAYEPEIEDCLFSDLWIHDVYAATTSEAFGIQTLYGASNWKYRNIQCWNISGTGLHASGWDYDTNTRTNNVRFENVQCWDCRWQGVSVFGARDITMHQVRAWRCGSSSSSGGNAINIEVAENVTLNECVGTESKYGLAISGPSTVTVTDSRFYANGETFGGFASDDAEVVLRSGIWRDGAGVIVLSGPPTTVELGPGTRIDPTTHDFHIFSRARLSPVAAGNVPEAIILSSEHAQDWTWRVERIDATGSGLEDLDDARFCNVTYPQTPVLIPVPCGNLSTLAQSGTMTVTPYSGGDNLDPGAVTLASSVTTSQRRTGVVLKTGRRYLIKTRVKPADAGAWVLRTRTASSTGNLGFIVLSQAPESVGTWFTGEMIVTADADYRLQYQWTVTDAVTSSSLVVDYLSVFEIPSDYGQSKIAGPLVSADRGDAAATLVAQIDEGVQRWATTLTADRAVTLSTVASGGATFRIVRTAGGAFNLNIGAGPLKALAANQWCEVSFTGSAWVLTAAGSL